jgi:integron integrase
MHYSRRTEAAYVSWIDRYIRFHGMRHPRELGHGDLVAFLDHLAREQRVAASTQNQALCAIVYLYRHVLGLNIEGEEGHTRARRPKRLPQVLSLTDVRRVIACMKEPYALMASLLYGCGLRVSECVSLRVKDVDFHEQSIAVRDGKGKVDRIVMLPRSCREDLFKQVERVRALYLKDRQLGLGRVDLPGAFARKAPKAALEFGWQYLFPASRTCIERFTGKRIRSHVHESALQREVTAAARVSQISGRATCHILRHSFATHLLQSGTDIRTLQALLGHKDLRTTMVYTHLARTGPYGVRSPLDY